jgi:hypothetical protein
LAKPPSLWSLELGLVLLPFPCASPQAPLLVHGSYQWSHPMLHSFIDIIGECVRYKRNTNYGKLYRWHLMQSQLITSIYFSALSGEAAYFSDMNICALSDAFIFTNNSLVKVYGECHSLDRFRSPKFPQCGCQNLLVLYALSFWPNRGYRSQMLFVHN